MLSGTLAGSVGRRYERHMKCAVAAGVIEAHLLQVSCLMGSALDLSSLNESTNCHRGAGIILVFPCHM